MGSYRAVVRYHFKKGMEEKGMKFIENEVFKKASECGSYGIELWIDDKDPSVCVGTGIWNSLEDAQRFRAHWAVLEKEAMKLCSEPPKREIFKIKGTSFDKAGKVA